MSKDTWSTDDIIANASNWSLAGDASLLKHLESFSENLFAKANETNDNLNHLLDNLNTASIKLDLVKNEFLGLQNTQFIESRVYEDDETLEEISDVPDTKVTDEAKKEALKIAVLEGLEVLDKYYDKVSLPASDSEDDEEFVSYILRPRDPYLDRPLPYLIGSLDWYKKSHVGLEDSSSDSEVEKIEEDKFSDTDSESNLPITDRRGISTSDSGTDISNRMERPAANSTFHDTMVSTDSEDYTNSIPAKAPISNANFAEQLAAKLGNVVSTEENPPINQRPIQTTAPAHTKVIGDLFADEPPPLDDPYDGKPSHGMFSGGGGLFDDSEEDEPFWGSKTVSDKQKPILNEPKKKNASDLFGDENDGDIFKGNSEKPKPTKGLFEDDDVEEPEDDEDIFASFNKPTQQKPFLKPFTTVPPFINDEPPELTTEVKKKKPTGGVSLFGNTDIFAGSKVGALLPKRRPSTSESETSTTSNGGKNDDKHKESLFDDEKKKPEKNNLSLFDDNDDLKKPTDDKLKKPEKKVNNLSLFDDNDDLKKPTDEKLKKPEKKVNNLSLFDDDDLQKPIEEKLKKPEKKINNLSLFDDDDDLKKPTEDKLKKPEKKINNESLFDDAADLKKPIEDKLKNEELKPKKISLFGDTDDLFKDDLFSNIGIKKFSSNLFDDLATGNNNGLFEESPKKKTPQKKKISLFDDEDEEEIVVKPKKIEEKPKNLFKQESSDEENIFVPKTKENPNFNLFHDTPPPDLDDWDTKSDMFDDEDIFDDVPSSTANRSLFDNEPPSLEEESKNQKSKTKISLFEDEPPEEDISSTIKDNKPPEIAKKPEIAPKSEEIVTKVATIKKLNNIEEKNINLFDDQPPEIDETFDKQIKESKQISLFDDKPPEIEETKKISLFDEPVLKEAITNSNQIHQATKKKLSLFDDEPPEIKEEDKFVTQQSLFDDKPSEIKDATVTNTQITKVPKPHVAPRKVMKAASLFDDNSDDDLFVMDESSKDKPKKESPGKLKLNLNINVAALIPGAAPPRKRDQSLNKSHSLDDGSNQVEKDEVIAHSQSTKNIPRVEDDDEIVNTLYSINKSRAKIPIKRKPSTRRARHQSMKRSQESQESQVETQGNEDNGNTTEIETNATPLAETEENQKKEDLLNKNEVLNVSNDDDDIFNDNVSTKDLESGDAQTNTRFKSFTEINKIVEDHKKAEKKFEEGDGLFGKVYPEDLFKKVKPNVTKYDKKQSIFDDSDDLDTLFTKKPVQEEKKAVSLFDDDTDDLFGKVVERPKTAAPGKTGNMDFFSTKTKKMVGKKGSLFDDVSDEDDIFASSSGHKPPSSTTQSKTKVVTRTTKGKSLRKPEEQQQITEDPLDALK